MERTVTVNTETRQRVNENGRVVIPASFRKALGINIGDEVVLRMEDDELIAERREAARNE
jgi:AbrB family looped-hinge helix DNA binding protein